MNRYAMAAHVLRLLVDGEPIVLDGEPVRSVLRIAAEACEQVDREHRHRNQALQRIAELEDLLARAADVLEAAPLPLDGGSWTTFTVSQELRRALGKTRRA